MVTRLYPVLPRDPDDETHLKCIHEQSVMQKSQDEFRTIEPKQVVVGLNKGRPSDHIMLILELMSHSCNYYFELGSKS